MALDTFWYEDCRLFECFMKAYRNRTNRDAWLYGLYVFEAVSCGVNNTLPSAVSKALTGKGRWKPLKYHDKPLGTDDLRARKKTAQASQLPNVASGVAAWSQRISQLKGRES